MNDSTDIAHYANPNFNPQTEAVQYFSSHTADQFGGDNLEFENFIVGFCIVFDQFSELYRV